MEYKVYNDSCIKNKTERLRSRKLIKKQVKRLERFNTGYPKNLTLNLYVNRTEKEQYQLTAIIRLKQGTVVIKHNGENPEAIIYSLFDRLKLTLSKKLHQHRNERLRQKQNIRIRSFKENLPELIELKKEGADALLRDLLKVLLQDISKYVRRRLKTAEMTSALSKGKFKLQELLDEIFLIIYDKLDEIPKDGIENKLWLYKVTDEYLANKFQELEFEKENIDRIESIVENEYNSLEEKYTIDAEYEIIPLEELDEFENHQVIYSVNDLQYNESEESLLDDLILKFNEKDIHEIIEKEIAKLPLFKRTIMDLYLNDQMTVYEISKIKNVSETTVEAVIKEVNSTLQL